MRERDSLSKLLARHGTGVGDAPSAAGRHLNRSRSTPLFDTEAKVRILDASLGLFAALRELAVVAEDILRERRDSLRGGEVSESRTSGESDPDEVRDADASVTKAREQIPLTY
jgi:hypothetical protein